jgi:hypothetical protein
MNKLILIAAALLLPAAALADAHSEIVTAEQHADYGAGSADIAGVHMHLHHTVNCLVGPGGNGFDAKELNPCAQAGNGAIPDAAPDKRPALEAAAAKAREGIAASDLATAKKHAVEAHDMLHKLL